MATSLDICNMALVSVGQEPIMSFDDQDKRARLCKQLYEQVKKSLLRSYSWTFAVRRARLAMEQDAPAFGHAHSFRLPSDCLRIVEMDTQGLPFNLEGGGILTDAHEVKLRYVADIEDATAMDAQFVEVLANQIACAIVTPLTADAQLLQQLLEIQKSKIGLAINTHAIEDAPMQVIEGNWISSRM